MKIIIYTVLCIFFFGCAQSEKNAFLETSAINDTHTYSNPNQYKIDHLHLDLKVDFDKRMLEGYAQYHFNKMAGDTLILDTKGLNIKKVTDINDLNTIQWALGEKDPILGAPLYIFIKDTLSLIKIYYNTTTEADAIQWFEPQQTLGKKHPFMFTQSQAILARTWVPTPDGPGIRFTYTARIQVPKGLLALMSATNPQNTTADGIYTFEQKNPIPAYLLALSVGNIAFNNLGKQTGVYAEPELIQAAAAELDQTEEMLKVAENLYGSYQWGRYDILMLPPSFPFGGMENPCLTFATPTILAGDKSLTSLIAHELSHSWSGNLVTNATWNDFWLNEGFTVYFERRIIEALKGPEYAQMLSYLGWIDLQNTLSELGFDSKDTHLKLDLDGRNPDDGMNDIAYEKGYFLLTNLEKTVSRPVFDKFLKDYFTVNAFKSMTTEGFLSYVMDFLPEYDSTKRVAFEIEEWIYKSGIPKNFNVAVPKKFVDVDKTVMLLINKGEMPDTNVTVTWSTHEWLYFLNALKSKANFALLKQLDDTFQFSKQKNAELLSVWFQLAINQHYDPAYAYLEQFLNNVGRRKFVKPLFQAIISQYPDKVWANKLYITNKKTYHSVTKQTIEALLN